MNDKAMKELEKLTESDSGLDTRQLVKISFRLLQEFDNNLREVIENIKILQREMVDNLKGLQGQLRRLQKEEQEFHDTYPSLTWLLRHRTRETLLGLTLFFVLSFFVIAFAPLLGRLLWGWFGLPPLP